MIKYIHEDALLEIKNNRSLLFKRVISSGTDTLEEAFKNPDIIKDTNIPGETFSLDMSSSKPELTDFENAKRMYNNMRALSPSQASDERIWAAYSLSVFKDYMVYRWQPKSESEMMNRFFFSYSPKRSLFRHGIARLWWIGYLTFDPERLDKYELTEYVCRKQDNINLLLDINFANNPVILRTVIQALIDTEKEGFNVDRETVRGVSEYINTLGGTYLVDSLDANVVYEKTKRMINWLRQDDRKVE